ncbi:hypothetical protein LXL04_035210 [Taraxacum kok-saghyz]
MWRGDDGEWKTVERRRDRHQEGGRKESNADELKRLVTSFFVSNLPGGWDSRRLWKAFEGQGRLVDAFVPKKKDASGRHFGFVRFLKVSNLGQLLRSLNDLVFDGRKLRVNVARHVRGKETRRDKVRIGMPLERSYDGSGSRPRQTVSPHFSFREALNGRGHHGVEMRNEETRAILNQVVKVPEVVIPDENELRVHTWLDSCLVGELKDIELLSKCMSLIHTYGLGDCNIRYLGGLTVLLEFNSNVIADCFLRNQRVNWSVWFGALSKWKESFNLESRAIWLKIRGVPVNCWDSKVFSSIAEQYGRVLIPFDCPEEAMDMSYGKVCVLRPSMEHLSPCNVVVKWRTCQFTVSVLKDGEWKPVKEDIYSTSDSDEELDQLFEEGEFLNMEDEDVSQAEVQSPTFGEGRLVSEKSESEKRHANRHAPILEEVKNINVTLNETHANRHDEDCESQGDEVYVEDTPVVGGNGGSVGPVSQLNENSKGMGFGPGEESNSVEAFGLPDLNDPSVGLNSYESENVVGTSHQEKGTKKKFQSVRLKDILINANLSKKKINSREKEREKERCRMEGLKLGSKLEGWKRIARVEVTKESSDQKMASSSSSDEVRKTIEIGDAIGYCMGGNEPSAGSTKAGAGVMVDPQ